MHRDATIHFKRLLQGVAGAPDNCELTPARAQGVVRSPRHHHNFDQIRIGISGLFGGASGSGFTHYDELCRTCAEMGTLDRFEAGHCYRAEGSSVGPAEKVRQDGYAALWQHLHGRPVVYPRPGDESPIVIHPEGFGWVTDTDQPGVARRLLGVSTERCITISQVRAGRGARCVESAGHALRLVCPTRSTNRPAPDAPIRTRRARTTPAAVEARAGAVSCIEVSKIGPKSGYGFDPQALKNFALLATLPGRPERACFRRGGAQEYASVGWLSGPLPAEVGRDRTDAGSLLAYDGGRLQSRRRPASETLKARLDLGFNNTPEFRWSGLGPRADCLGTDPHRRRLDCLGLSGRAVEASKPRLLLNPVAKGLPVLTACAGGAHRRLCKRRFFGANPLFPLVGLGGYAPESWYEAEGTGSDFVALLTASLAAALGESRVVPWIHDAGSRGRCSRRLGGADAPAA